MTAGWVCWTGDGWTVTSGTGRAMVISGSCEAGAALGVGGVEPLADGLAPQRSPDDGRMGESSCAGGAVTEGGVTMGTADLGCSWAWGAGADAEAPSKLKGLRCSVGGGSGETGEMAWSLSCSGLSVGEGVHSGVSVSIIFVGGGGAGR